MAIYLTQTQIDQIRALYLAGPNAQGNFSHIYKFIGDLLPESDEKNWFRGAEQANAGQGAYSALIRTYSQRQMQLRGIGGAYTPALMQAASNKVATNALKDILGLDGYPSRVQPDGTSLFPTMVDIARNDAIGVGRILFASLPVGDSARGDEANAGWSGTIFFSALNEPQTVRLISANGPTLDVLEDLKNVLFAYDALKAGLDAAFSQGWDEKFRQQLWTDLGILVDTWNGSSLNAWDVLKNKLTALLPPSAKPFGQLIQSFSGALGLDWDRGVGQLLDWIQSSIDGQRILSGSTDAVHRATAVLGSLTVAQQQSWRVQILPESRDSIVSLAKIDESVRNALVALSPIAVTKPSYSGDLSLYDSSTGLGALTDAWLRDRASFLTWERLYRNAGQTDGVFEMPGGLPVPISGDILYNDGASGYQLRIDGVDNFVVPTKLVTFGGIGNDVLSGNTADDHLYGGGGVDTIHGGDGNDYLQGDAGNDEMFGDNNDDLLLGMDGNDKLDGGEGMDSLQGGRGDDELKGGDGAYFDPLYGGEDDDTLIGGKGDDFLSGDEGNDTYKYTTGDGRDTIKDIDGLGSILFDGQAMSIALAHRSILSRPSTATQR